MKRIIRVFPRRTKATPTDDLAAINRGPDMLDQADEVHVSVAFTWDLPRAEQLAAEWRHVAPVTIGGPATGQRSGAFTPGLYVREGYTITSRGCPNTCWFCNVWQREGTVRELPIAHGWNVLDDNLLACSPDHIADVIDMLRVYKATHKIRPQFTGGLEAARMTPAIARALRTLRPKQLFFAFDNPDELENLVRAGQMMLDAGFTTRSHQLRCYVLCGYPRDTERDAVLRMRLAMTAGFTPMAMLYRDHKGDRDPSWMRLQKQWARPANIHHS